MTVDDAMRLLTRGLQALLVGILAWGLVRANAGVAVNAGVSLAVTFLPAWLRRDYRIPADPGLTLWVTAAVAMHAVGALGVYRSVPWYDQVAHALSASVVAAAGYAGARALDLVDEVEIPRNVYFVVVLVFVLAFGVVWELLEFASSGLANALGMKSVLVVYGADDIALDLVFDAVGGVVVAVWGTGHLQGVASALGRHIRAGRHGEP